MTGNQRIPVAGSLPIPEWALVAALTTLAALLRLPALIRDGLWRDEANVYVQLTAPNFAEFFGRVMRTEWHPPLYFLMMYGWSKIAGTGEIALTIVPFGFSVATAIIVYRLGRAVDSRAAGAVAAGLYAVAPLAIAYSDEYLYPLMMFVSTLLAWVVVDAFRKPLTPLRIALLGGATLLVVATHYSGLIYVALLLLWALSRRAALARRLAVAGTLVAGAAPFVLWLPIFLAQRSIGLPYRSAATALGEFAFVARTLLSAVPLRPALPAFVFSSLLLGVLIVLMRARKVNRDAATFGVMFGIALLTLAGLNLLEARYLLAFFGPFCVFGGALVARWRVLVKGRYPRWWRGWGVGMISALGVVFVVSGATRALRDSALPKSGISTIAHRPAADAVTLYVLAPDYLASTFAFYAQTASTHYAGFVRWREPEVFRLASYAADWNRKDAVARSLADIASADRQLTRLDVVVDDRARDSGLMPYGKVNLLLAELRRRYRFLDRTRHPGRYESVSEYHFAR